MGKWKPWSPHLRNLEDWGFNVLWELAFQRSFFFMYLCENICTWEEGTLDENQGTGELAAGIFCHFQSSICENKILTIIVEGCDTPKFAFICFFPYFIQWNIAIRQNLVLRGDRIRKAAEFSVAEWVLNTGLKEVSWFFFQVLCPWLFHWDMYCLLSWAVVSLLAFWSQSSSPRASLTPNSNNWELMTCTEDTSGRVLLGNSSFS